MSQSSRRRWSAPSVRTRIVAVITVVALLGLLSVGIVVYLVERAHILATIDDRLADNLESAVFLVESGHPDTGTWATADEALAAVVQRMSPDANTGALGIVNGRAALQPGVPLDVDLMAAPDFAAYADERVAAKGPVIGTYAEHGVHWRYLAVPVTLDGVADDRRLVFTMAYDIDGRLAEINDAARAYVIAAGTALAIIAVVAAIVSTRLLRPLRRMRETAALVSAQSLSERLPVEGRDDVSELAATMNSMLDRLDEAMDSQRRLLSDVGHELKTPITIVRGHLEVMDPTDPEDVAATRELVVDELERMAGLVQDLGRAAALHGPSPVSPVPVDVADLLDHVVRKAQGIERAQVASGPVVDAVAMLDPDRITQALLQLVQNAITHGEGEIVIGSTRVADTLELWVRDHGNGVADADKETVFDRFHRGEQGGSGLGLHIVQVIARAHGGAARVGDAADGGAVFTLSLPRALSARAAGAGRS